MNNLGATSAQTGATLLQHGIAAAKTGDKTAAQSMLLQAMEIDPGNALGWLWLASLVENEEQAIQHLRRVLAIDPQHAQAQEFLRRVLITQGIKSAKANDKIRARIYLMEASEQDPRNEMVWLWLSSVAEDSLKAEICLRKALEINPGNKKALEWLLQLQSAVPAASAVRRCPFCDAARVETRKRCVDCKALLTLAGLEADLDNREVDRGVLLRALERYRRQAERQEDFDVNYLLGLVYLSLDQLTEAVRYLHRAGSYRPQDEELKAQVDLLWKRERASNQTQRRERKGFTTPRTILIIDDSATVRKLVSVTLERRGHRVLTANGAMEALARLSELTPDLILLDITLPHTDGYQICKLIKKANNTKRIPVVILSGKDGFFDKVRGRTAGAVGYITKPFEPAALIKIVENYCNQLSQREERGRDGHPKNSQI